MCDAEPDRGMNIYLGSASCDARAATNVGLKLLRVKIDA
jgi:hypothetical protein